MLDKMVARSTGVADEDQKVLGVKGIHVVVGVEVRGTQTDVSVPLS